MPPVLALDGALADAAGSLPPVPGLASLGDCSRPMATLNPPPWLWLISTTAWLVTVPLVATTLAPVAASIRVPCSVTLSPTTLTVPWLEDSLTTSFFTVLVRSTW